ncbi:MAG TPA: cation diffusion facilitator family transporter [Bdellovibrionota bacterium]|nr:cation diffusion facilitator family transporter [Bdellovibrionota bacterium]
MIDHGREVKRILWIALFMNIVVSAAKATYGLMTGTLSMIADGAHSLTDAGSSIMGLVSVHFAVRPSDNDHHYGHHKYETLAALGIGGFIALTSWEILKNAIHRLTDLEHPEFHPSGLGIMLVTMAVNLGLSKYERKKGREYRSSILTADAYHTASDFWVSLSVVVTLIAVRFDWAWVDPVVSLGIAIYFAYIAYKVVSDNVLDLSDAAFVDPREIERLVLDVPGILSCHRVRTRGRHGNIFVDLHVQIEPETTTAAAHAIVHNAEMRIKSHIDGIRDVIIHTEPYPDDDTNPRIILPKS